MMKSFEEIAIMQEELDQRIAKKFNIQINEVINEKILAMMVELGELANEVRSFKFWSKTKKDNKSKIWEEYVDGLHFLLSFGNYLQVDHIYEINKVNDVSDKKMTNLFNDIFCSVAELAKNKDKQNYKICMKKYLSLGTAIGLTYEDMIIQYKFKNNKNHIRQDKDY